MAGLPDAKIDIVRNLVEQAPDKLGTGLQNALAAAAGDTALAGVRRVVEAEVADRNLRNKVLEPIAPLFAGDLADASHIAFPRRALALLWRGLKASAPAEVSKAARALIDYRPDESSTEPFDLLAEMVADGLRDAEQRDFVAAIEMLEAGFTTVGEFHYLHHDPAGQPYGDIGEMANLVRPQGLVVRQAGEKDKADTFRHVFSPPVQRHAAPHP